LVREVDGISKYLYYGHSWQKEAQVMGDKKPALKDFVYYSLNDKNLEIIGKKHLKLTGDSINDIYLVLSLCNGNHTINDIANLTNLEISYVQQIVDLLENSEITFNIIDKYENNSEHLLPVKRYNEQYLDEEQRIFDLTNGYSINILFMGNIELVEMLYKRLTYFNTCYKYCEDQMEEYKNNIDMIICVTTFEDKNQFMKAEKISEEIRVPMFRIKIENTNINIGPIFIPFEGYCYSCYLNRFYSNLNQNEQKLLKKTQEYEINQNTEVTKLKYIPGSFDIMCGLLENQIYKFFSNYQQSDIVGFELKFSLENLTFECSPILKLPNCKCSKYHLEGKEVLT
jgi:hypothetical protein